jgi:hypothetical protein
MKKLLFTQPIPEDIAAAWSKLSDVSIEGSKLRLKCRRAGRACVSKSLKNIGVLSFLTVVSRVLGLARDSSARDLRGGAVMSAFTTANIGRTSSAGCSPRAR